MGQFAKEDEHTLRRSVLLLLITMLLVVACGSPTPATEPIPDTALKLAPVSDLSPELRQLAPEIQQAWRFAVANPDILSKIPCYCGCGGIRHMDNYMCYVRPESAAGQVVFDFHAAG